MGLELDTTIAANEQIPPQSREASSVDLKVDFMTAVHEVAPEQAREDMDPPPMEHEHKHDLAPVANEPTPPQTRAPSPELRGPARPHAEFVLWSSSKLSALQNGTDVVLDGQSLDIPSVVAVAK